MDEIAEQREFARKLAEYLTDEILVDEDVDERDVLDALASHGLALAAHPHVASAALQEAVGPPPSA